MFSTDPYLALRVYDQRSRYLREQAARHALVRQARRGARRQRRSWWAVTQRRLRAPALP
ncbi:MAG TPA: hypothetical protein VJT31_13495 [Rugosimonospora sp.]|nr:hypothetical protein [Rugosimonospora sp.]